jgi:hypothetical protein
MSSPDRTKPSERVSTPRSRSCGRARTSRKAQTRLMAVDRRGRRRRVRSVLGRPGKAARRVVRAQRYAYTAITGNPVPDGLMVLHRCDVPVTCAPTPTRTRRPCPTLRAGTRRDIMDDRTRRHRTGTDTLWHRGVGRLDRARRSRLLRDALRAHGGMTTASSTAPTPPTHHPLVAAGSPGCPGRTLQGDGGSGVRRRCLRSPPVGIRAGTMERLLQDAPPSI